MAMNLIDKFISTKYSKLEIDLIKKRQDTMRPFV